MFQKLRYSVIAGSVALAGCSLSGGELPQAPDCALPGDIDCSNDVGGKADAWDGRNDPARLSRNLNYRLDELPLSGETQRPVWAASYWPTYAGSTNNRWQGDSTLSPLEKYDAAVNAWTPTSEYATSVPRDCGPDAQVEFGAYVASRGPAAAWQSGAQSRDLLFNGRDDDGDGTIDQCYERIETWWGLCHAWAPAAILEPEPLRAVDYGGQRFEVADIKALIITAYDDTAALGLGGRCNAQVIDHDDTGRVSSPECRDTNAGAWHVIVTNFLGLNDQPFVEDRTGNYQVWNQPVLGYEISSLEEIDAARANGLLGVSGDSYTYNPRAQRLFEVEMRTDWLTEGHPSRRPLGSADYTLSDDYHYILELDAAGKVIGGEWVGDSRDEHPDFLWVPRGARTGPWSRSNPHVDLGVVRDLVARSRQ